MKIDLVFQQAMGEKGSADYSYMNVIYTDMNGTFKENPLKLVRNSLSRPDITGGIINFGFVAYEVKTYNPSSTPATLFDAFKEGLRQTIERAYLQHINAGILVFDKLAFQNLRNSQYGPQVTRLVNDMKKYLKNGDQAVYLLLEDNLWQESNNALHGLTDIIDKL